MIKKIKGKWCIVHHKKKGMIGKPIRGGCHPTRTAAVRQHAAIFASKK